MENLKPMSDEEGIRHAIFHEIMFITEQHDMNCCQNNCLKSQGMMEAAHYILNARIESDNENNND